MVSRRSDYGNFVMVSYLDFILCMEEAIEKTLLNWFLGAPSSNNVEDRWTGVKLKVEDH